MLITEKSNPNTLNLHEMSALEIVQTMNAEDVTISQAVQRALPEIASAVDLIMGRLEKADGCFTLEQERAVVWESWMLQNVLQLSERFRKRYKALSPEEKQ